MVPLNPVSERHCGRFNRNSFWKSGISDNIILSIILGQNKPRLKIINLKISLAQQMV